jgi:hypothetical protein
MNLQERSKKIRKVMKTNNDYNEFLRIPPELINLILEFLRVVKDPVNTCHSTKDLNMIAFYENIRTQTLFKLSYTCKDLHQTLFKNHIIMKNCPMTLKNKSHNIEYNIDYIVSNCNPTYLIRNLLLKENQNINDEQVSLLEKFENIFFKISSLSISECNDLTEKSFKYFKKIEALTLNRCDKIKFTQDIFKGFENLKTLNIDTIECTYRLEENVFTPLKKLKNLKIHSLLGVVLNECTFNKLINLEHLDISGVCNLQIKRGGFINKLKKIKSLLLEVTGSQYYVENLQILIDNCKKIKALKLNGFKCYEMVGDNHQLNNDENVELTRLNSYDNNDSLPRDFNKKTFDNIVKNLTNIEIFNLCELNTHINCWNNKIHFQNIKELTLNYLNLCISNNEKIFDDLENLRVLRIRNDSMTKKMCNINGIFNTLTNRVFKKLSKLRVLEATYCTFFTDEIFKVLTNLICLNVSGCDQLDGTHFHMLKKLKVLDMSRTTISGEFFMHYENEIEVLKADECENINTKMFENFKNIQYLDIDNCQGPFVTSEDFRIFGEKLKVLKILESPYLDIKISQYIPNLIELHIRCKNEENKFNAFNKRHKWTKKLKNTKCHFFYEEMVME